MLLRLLLLFTIVPIVELAILIPLGGWMGVWPTLALIVATGVLGAVLGKHQGVAAWRRIQRELSQGQLPSDSLLDGLAVLIAGAFLVTPGVLTDIAGMTLLLPALRSPLKKYLKNRFKKAIEGGSVTYMRFEGPFGGAPSEQRTGKKGDEEVIDVTPEERAEEDEKHRQLP